MGMTNFNFSTSNFPKYKKMLKTCLEKNKIRITHKSKEINLSSYLILDKIKCVVQKPTKPKQNLNITVSFELCKPYWRQS